jgi:membrane associated rhomboid family serine protease
VAAITVLKGRAAVRLLRFGLTGAIAAALLFTGLWIAARLPIGPSDMIVGLFTTRPSESTAGLREGVLNAALIGFFAGALVNLVYQSIHWLEKR